MTEKLEVLIHRALDTFNIELPSWGFATASISTTADTDDDLTLGSIDPYQIFRIFHEIHNYAWENGAPADVAYMVDQSHNLKGKMEAMIQTVCTAQELYAKAAIVDHARLAPLQQSCSLVEAEETLRGAFWYDVRAGLARMAAQSRSAGRSQAGLPGQRIPEAITAERKERNAVSVTTYA